MIAEEKLSKAVKLTDAMYYAAQMLSTDASHLRKAIEDWWHLRMLNLTIKNKVMKEMIKSMAVTTGLGLPFFTIVYSCNPDFSNWDAILLGLGFAICKELVVWGLKE